MNDKIKIGFVGAGFVGGAMIRAFSGYNPMAVYDRGKGIGTMEEVVEFADVIFVSVPTPMRKDGSCDTRIVEEVVMEIDKVADLANKGEQEVVIRSTVPPQFLENLWDNTENVQILFMPEFLTERTADLDFINATRFIIGTQDPYSNSQYEKTRQVFTSRFPRTRVPIMTFANAALVKYGTNNFFTVKLSFFNELYNTALDNGADPDLVVQEILQDGRIGRSHFQVPGHDGDLGWGGHCFPKDNRGLSFFTKHSKMIDAAWEVNEEVREDRNWEEQKGRAVSED